MPCCVGFVYFPYLYGGMCLEFAMTNVVTYDVYVDIMLMGSIYLIRYCTLVQSLEVLLNDPSLSSSLTNLDLGSWM